MHCGLPDVHENPPELLLELDELDELDDEPLELDDELLDELDELLELDEELLLELEEEVVQMRLWKLVPVPPLL